MNATNLKMTLSIFLLTILMGCQTQPTINQRPTKPTLKIQPNNGGICLDKENAQKLGAYILELENNFD